MRGDELVIAVSDGVASLAQFERGGRLRELVRQAFYVLPEGLEPAALAAHLAGLASGMDAAPEDLGLVLDGAGVLVREFSLPFNQPAKVQRAVRFEMDSGLPCKPGDLAGDVLIRRVGKGCRIFSFSLRKDGLRALLDGLAESGLDPSPVSVDLAALAAFCGRLPDGTAPVCVVDVGFGRCLLAVVGPDGVQGLARRECGPGRAVDASDRTRQEVLDGTLPGEGFEGPLLSEALAEMERAVRQLCLSCGLEPGRVLLCGSGAGLPGVARGLEQRLGVAVADVWSAAEPEGFGLRDAVSPLVAGALEDAGLVGARRTRGLNLRRGEFGRMSEARGLVRRYAWAGAMALVLLVAWGASFVAQGVERSRVADAGAREIREVFSKAVPDAKGDFSRTQMFSILKTRIDRLRGQGEQGDEGPATRVVEILRAVNAAAPANLDVDLEALTAGDDGGRIMGTARDYQAVNALLERVAAGGVLADVRIVVASAVQKTGRVRFELEYARK